MRHDVTFISGGERCAAWHWTGERDAFSGPAGRPCVVMAHGFGHTRDSGLEPFAERFAAEGLDVLLFDYRTFGASDGEPRQLVDWRRHRDDYRAAIGCARGVAGVDPDRIVLFGTSYSGGHVIAVGADDGRVAAVIAMTPAVDGLAVLLHTIGYAGLRAFMRTTALAVRDAVGALFGRPPVRIPLVGPPGTVAAISTPDAEPGSRAIAGPTFRNEFCARSTLTIGLNRPGRRAPGLLAPLLLQVVDEETIAPKGPVARVARTAGGPVELRRYPGGHFDVYVDGRERVLADQVAFLHRHLDRTSDATGTGGRLAEPAGTATVRPSSDPPSGASPAR